MLGLYRAYYELMYYDKDFKDKVAVQIIADGYDKLTPEFLESVQSAGIYDPTHLEHEYLTSSTVS